MRKKRKSFRERTIARELPNVLANSELFLVYEPIIQQRLAVGAEALLRWNHPGFGIIPPMDFIPLAERKGTIVPIGYWVLETALRQLKEWLGLGFGLTVAVNLSPRQFRDECLVDKIKSTIHDVGIPPYLVELEITESTVMENPEESVKRLHTLKEFSVRLVMDDFGTGHSSLENLQNFPVSKLKLGRSFTKDVHVEKTRAIIVKAVVDLAHELGITVCAEGIETEDQLAFVHGLGCDFVQGFYFTRSLTAEKMTEWLKQRRGY